jgi:hypothetical protein
MTWFKSNPSDCRVQSIMSHGANNWALNLDGTTGHLVWTTVTGGSVTSTGILNDGLWHFAAGVSDGSHIYLYVDGQLNISAALAAGVVGEPTAHLFLGGNADNVQVESNQRYFAGAIAQAAFYTNALTFGQIQAVYGIPTITMTNLVIQYTGTLLSSTNVSGPYNPVGGASSPYTVPATNAQQFYRASIP